MTDRITLELQQRSILGKKVKTLRGAGIVPVHLYGPGISPRHLQCPGQSLIKALTLAGKNIAISITVEGEEDEHLAFVREIQWNPIRGDLFHVDFLRAEATHRVSAAVPVLLTGTSPGARASSGTVVQQLFTLTVEALPLDMPQDLKVDLASLTEPNDITRAGDIPIPPEAVLLTNPNEVVVRIEAARVEAVEQGAPAPEDQTEEEVQEGG